jgi:hypothetical protein
MFESVYKIDGRFPDPHEVKNRLKKMAKDPSKEMEYKESLKEVKEAGMSDHPLLGQFFVES